MSWRETILVRVGVGAFAGITFGRWLSLLRENHFRIDRAYWLRALAITMGSLPNSVVALLERLRYDRRVRETTVEPPLFILGIWRSGTTHLHNLFARDERLAFPNNYQVFYPQTFLLTERFNSRLVDFCLPKQRPQDNVKMAVAEPQEDEFAFCSMTGRAVPTGWSFPRNDDYYQRYLTLEKLTAHELAEWKAALAYFVHKLAFKYQKPIVLKSPGHTCRIKVLLELFPNARFVHIHRNPYAVFQSTMHLFHKAAPWWALQNMDFSGLEERTIRQYREVYERYFRDRGLIPKGHLYDVGFEDLEADPIGQMRGIYTGLRLPAFEVPESALKSYVDSLACYKKNTFTDLPRPLRQRLAREWQPSFAEWGYPT